MREEYVRFFRFLFKSGVSIYIYIYIYMYTEPCALGSTQPLEMSTKDFSWGKGGRCVRLTTYHPRSAERQENPGP